MGFRCFGRSSRFAGFVVVSLTVLLGCLSGQQAHLPFAPAGGQLGDNAVLAASQIDAAETIELADLEKQFQRVAQKVAPAVVAISATVNRIDADDVLRSEDMTGQKLQTILDRTTRIVGTGFIIDPRGYILTNEHVVGEAQQLWVTTDDRTVYPAIVIGSDPRSDVAVLKIPAENLPTVSFREEPVSRGQWTIALGNPYGLATEGEMAMSVGVVSAVDRSLPKLATKENRLYSNLIQTTAEINPGNSGGPLFDIHGRVIGINTAVILPQKVTNGIGFAMPITPQFKATVEKLIAGREVEYAYLGVTVSTPTPRERRAAGIGDTFGSRIESIEKDSPATEAALKVDDIIVSVNGQPVRDSDHFVRLIGASPVGQPSTFTLFRDGKQKTVSCTLRKRQLPAVAVTRESQRLRWRGLLLSPIPEHWSGATRSNGVFVVAVDGKSEKLPSGITAGSIITAIGGKPVQSLLDLQQLINDLPAEQATIELAPATVSPQMESADAR
jgi:serine protease Do